MDFDFDEHGASVIDVQNNGQPDTSGLPARTLGIPWLAAFDCDSKGLEYIGWIKGRGFDESEINERCRTHPEGTLENQILADGLGPEVRDALAKLGVADVGDLADQDVIDRPSNRKTSYAAILSETIVGRPSLLNQCPSAFREAIHQLKEIA